MPRKLLIRSDTLPYHITARVNNREPFPIPLVEMWKILTFESLISRHLFDVHTHALVLMPNHFHALITTTNPEHDLGVVMKIFMSEITKSCHRISGRTGRLFGDRYFWSLIESPRYYGHALKYLYRNPVRAHLCQQVEEYEFSTLPGILGQTHLPVPLDFTECGFETAIPSPDPIAPWLKWLNQPFPIEAEKLIQKGLRKKHFHCLMDRERRKPIELLEGLL